MRILIVLTVALALAQAASAFTPRVVFFDDLVGSRAEAVSRCIGRGHCIAHDQQIKADLRDGYTGHHHCGFTWARAGYPLHVHCKKRDASGVHCLPYEAEIRHDDCPKQEKFGYYCRVQREGETLPHPCKDEDSDATEVFGIDGPFYTVGQALAGCAEHGSKLAWYHQVATYADRYGVQFCQFRMVQMSYAVYRFNCHRDGEIEYNVLDSSGPGYGAVCIGERPHSFHDPCKDKFPNQGGDKLYCINSIEPHGHSHILIQDRPVCEEETESFEGKAAGRHHWMNGFGEPGKGYWLGLKHLNRITEEHTCRLLVEMWDHENNYWYADYDHFEIGGTEKSDGNSETCQKQEYKLTVGAYTGTAGDAFRLVQAGGHTDADSYFSNVGGHDCDDSTIVDCANTMKSAWWFSSCTRSNLNGVCTDSAVYDPSRGQCRYWAPINQDTGHCMRRTRMSMRCFDDGDNE